MNTNKENDNDDLLKSMLQYNSSVTDQAFTEKVVSKVSSKHKKSNSLVIFAVLISLISAMSMIFGSSLTTGIESNTVWYLSLLLIATLGSGVWISSEDF
jgi:hypothetical protein